MTVQAKQVEAKAKKADRTTFVVLLYPPVGVPRVCEIPTPPPGFRSVTTFKTRAKADAALEKFLTENPEYRNWKDGRIQPTVATGGAA